MHKKIEIIANINKTQDLLNQNIDAIKKNNEASKVLVDLKEENKWFFNLVDAIPNDLIEKKGDKLIKVSESQYSYIHYIQDTFPKYSNNQYKCFFYRYCSNNIWSSGSIRYY